MEPLIDFGDVLTDLQHLPEREKIILVALINAHGTRENGDKAKIERLVAETIMLWRGKSQRTQQEILRMSITQLHLWARPLAKRDQLPTRA